MTVSWPLGVGTRENQAAGGHHSSGGLTAGWPLQGFAQTERPQFLRVATASPTPRRAHTSFLLPFERRLAELGYVEGINFALEFIQLRNLINLEKPLRR